MSFSPPGLQSLLLRWRLRRMLSGSVLGVGLAGLALALWSSGGGARLGGWLVAVSGFLAIHIAMIYSCFLCAIHKRSIVLYA